MSYDIPDDYYLRRYIIYCFNTQWFTFCGKCVSFLDTMESDWYDRYDGKAQTCFRCDKEIQPMSFDEAFLKNLDKQYEKST